MQEYSSENTFPHSFFIVTPGSLYTGMPGYAKNYNRRGVIYRVE